MTRPRSRALDRLLVATFVSAWLLLFVPWLYTGITRGHRWYRDVGTHSFWTGSASDYPIFYRVDPDGLLREGDRWIRVEDLDLRGVTWFDLYEARHEKVTARAPIRYEVERDGHRVELLMQPAPRPFWWSGVPGAVATVLAATFLLLRAPRWRLARRFFSAMLLWSLFFAANDFATSPALQVLADVAIGPAAMALLLWFAFELTEAAQPLRTWQRVAPWVVGGVQAVLWASMTFLPLSLGTSIASSQLWKVHQAAFLLLVIAGAARAYRLAGPLERRQIKWILYGLFVGLLPQTALLLGDVVGVRVEPWVPAVTACLAAIPAGFVVAVVGYRWLDIDRLISATASYTIVGLAVLGGALAIIPRFALAAAPAVGIDPAIAQWLLTMMLVAAAIPVHQWLWPWIDQRIFAERHQRMLSFERLLDEIGGYASVDELVRLAAERIDALLEPDSIAVYAREGTSFAPLLVRGRAAPRTFEADSLLVRALERRGRPLWADAEELDAFDRATLETLGVSLVVPTRGREGVVAFACLGPKRSGDIYTPEEIAQLGAVADRCSAVLLRLVDERGAPSNAEPLPHVFRRDGEFWTIASAGKEIRLRDMRGLHYLATLLREPGREFQVGDLVEIAGGGAAAPAARDPSLAVVGGLGDAGVAIDGRARAAYRERLRALDDEQAKAERNSDLGTLGVLAAEREALLAELEAAARGRRAASHSERARTAVTKSIKAALDKIAERHPELGAHLSATIRRGYACAYVPDPRVPVEWEV